MRICAVPATSRDRVGTPRAAWCIGGCGRTKNIVLLYPLRSSSCARPAAALIVCRARRDLLRVADGPRSIFRGNHHNIIYYYRVLAACSIVRSGREFFFCLFSGEQIFRRLSIRCLSIHLHTLPRTSRKPAPTNSRQRPTLQYTQKFKFSVKSIEPID